MDFTDRPGEVADPWYTDDFDTTWRDVEEGCRGCYKNNQQEGADKWTSWLSRERKLVYNGIPSEMIYQLD